MISGILFKAKIMACIYYFENISLKHGISDCIDSQMNSQKRHHKKDHHSRLTSKITHA